MALIKCPECGKEISDKASACIHCGYPIANNQQQQTNTAQAPIASLSASEDIISKGFTLFSFDEKIVNLECKNCEKVYKFNRRMNFTDFSEEGCVANLTVCCPNCGNTLSKGLRIKRKQVEQITPKNEQQNEHGGKKDDASGGCLMWLIVVGILVAAGMFPVTDGFRDFTLWYLVFPLIFVAFIVVGLIYSFATSDPKEIKENWSKEKYNNYKFTCPMCGSKKVKKIGTVNRAVSIAAFGFASNKIGKQYECDACKHKW